MTGPPSPAAAFLCLLSRPAPLLAPATRPPLLPPGSLSCQLKSSAPSLLPGPVLLPPTGATTPTAPRPSQPAQLPQPAFQLRQSLPRPVPHTGPLVLLLRPLLLLLPLVLVSGHTLRKFFLCRLPKKRNSNMLTVTLDQAQSALLPSLVLHLPTLAPSLSLVSLPPLPSSWHKCPF